MNSIIWSSYARRQLRQIDRQFRSQITDAVDTLVDMPNVLNVRALSNHRYGYRLRVGHFRVLFDWHKMVKIVEIQQVKKRDEHTY